MINTNVFQFHYFRRKPVIVGSHVLLLLLLLFSFLLRVPPAIADESFYFPSPGYLLDLEALPADFAMPSDDQTKYDSAVDQSRTRVVERLQLLSKQIDQFLLNRFFGDQIIKDDDFSGSRARLAVITEHKPSQLLDMRVRLNLRLVLPNTDERLSLLLEAEDDQEDSLVTGETSEGDSINAALRYIIREKNRWRTNLDAGVRSGLPPKVFIRARTQRSWYVDDWSIRFRQTFGYFSNEGPASTTEFRSDYLFSRYQFFRFNSAAKYILDDNLYEFDVRLQVFKELNSQNAIAYGVQALGDTSRATDIYHYQLDFRWRRQMWRSWLFMEVTPALEWVEDKDFDVAPKLTLKIEALFDQY